MWSVHRKSSVGGEKSGDSWKDMKNLDIFFFDNLKIWIFNMPLSKKSNPGNKKYIAKLTKQYLK